LQSVSDSSTIVRATEPELGERFLYCDGKPALLFTENETNARKLFRSENRAPYVKDAFHEFIVHGISAAVNPDPAGTKVAAHYRLTVPARGSEIVRLRLTPVKAEDF